MANRILSLASVIFGVLLLTFLLIHLVPGDPVEVMLGESASMADRAQLREDLGLNQPLLSQFGSYLNKLAHGDLGSSIHTKTPIIELIKARYPATLKLALLALLIGLLIGISMGIYAALKANHWYGVKHFNNSARYYLRVWLKRNTHAHDAHEFT